ncbi:MAG: GNAT family N-acetyltransferase [Leucobacter sp.]
MAALPESSDFSFSVIPDLPDLPAGLALRAAHVDRIAPRTLYRIARLRQEVFVVEQDCVYLDLDGRDLEPGTRQMWVETVGGGERVGGPGESGGEAEAGRGGSGGSEAGEVAATVRILDESNLEPGLVSIGRVVTAPSWRGRGIAGVLLRHAIAACEGRPILIHAQAHLAEWYGGFGFVVSGDEFLEDGIPHIEMRIG